MLERLQNIAGKTLEDFLAYQDDPAYCSTGGNVNYHVNGKFYSLCPSNLLHSRSVAEKTKVFVSDNIKMIALKDNDCISENIKMIALVSGIALMIFAMAYIYRNHNKNSQRSPIHTS